MRNNFTRSINSLTWNVRPLLLSCLLFFPGKLFAEQWIATGDERTRFHVQVLADSGKLKSTMTTWPMMWVNVQSALNEVDIKDLNETELWSYQYLRHSLDRAKHQVSGVKRLHASNSRPAIVDFASNSREEGELTGNISVMLDRISFKVQANAIQNPIDGDKVRYDGSYGAVTWGNWVFGAGAIDRWWGPGWQSSLIMSNNARPAPGVFIHRKSSKAFENPFLSWIGAWDLQLFANQLEKDRYVPNAKLLGGRATIKPFRFFELGVSRTAQWGGEGRPETLSTLKNLIIGNDNRGKDGIAKDGSNEPGNQVFSYDWRIHLPFIKKISIALFHQQLSEDKSEAGLPFQNADTWGIESSFRIGDINNHVTFETYDSRNGTNGVIYEHSIYRSGYRTKNRTIGSSLDTATLGKTLLVEHYLANGHQIHWRLGDIDFNVDNAPVSRPAGHPYGNKHINENFFELQYKLPVNNHLLLNTGFMLLSEPLNYVNEDTIDSNISLGLEYHW